MRLRFVKFPARAHTHRKATVRDDTTETTKLFLSGFVLDRCLAGRHSMPSSGRQLPLQCSLSIGILNSHSGHGTRKCATVDEPRAVTAGHFLGGIKSSWRSSSKCVHGRLRAFHASGSAYAGRAVLTLTCAHYGPSSISVPGGCSCCRAAALSCCWCPGAGAWSITVSSACRRCTPASSVVT